MNHDTKDYILLGMVAFCLIMAAVTGSMGDGQSGCNCNVEYRSQPTEAK